MFGIFLDTETNGLNFFKHKILEIALKIYDLSNKNEIASYESIISISFEDFKQSDLNSLEITKFTYNEVKKGKAFSTVKDQIIKIFQDLNIKKDNSVFICQNPSFDRIFFSQIINPDDQETLKLPYHWLDLASMFWAIKILKNNSTTFQMIDFSKDSIAIEYNLAAEEKPHRAMNGVKHLIKCYEKVVGFPLVNILPQ